MSTGNVPASPGRPRTLLEQFIPDHLFIYVEKGAVTCYDGRKDYTLTAGGYGLLRKNRLAKYYSEKGTLFNRVMFCFDEAFLRSFQAKYQPALTTFQQTDTVIGIAPNQMIPAFIRSLAAYTNGSGKFDRAFEAVKYEELMIILLQKQPELAGLFFNYARPEKIDLEGFMNRNYRFNVRMERFALMTGRSLSAFKRDFKAIFKEAPHHWLIKKRLEAAYTLITQEGKKASEIYLELGFEDLSHFSRAFLKLHGLRPTELVTKPNCGTDGASMG